MQNLADEIIERAEELKSARLNFEKLWQEVSELVLPRKADFSFYQTQGAPRGRKLFETTAVNAAEMLAAGLHGLMTNPAGKWFSLNWGGKNRPQGKEAAQWLENAENVMRDEISRAAAGFATNIHEVYLDLAVLGTAGLYVGWNESKNCLLFQSRFLGELFIRENAAGQADTVYRLFKMRLEDIVGTWGVSALPETLRSLYAQGREGRRDFEIIHLLAPNRRGGKVGSIEKPVVSVYVLKNERHVLFSGGFEEMPLSIVRWSKATSEVYGRSPAMSALPDIKMIQEMMKETIISAQLSNRPPLLVRDDDQFSPAATVPGGIIRYSGEAPKAFSSGANSSIGLDIMNEIRDRIRTAFFNDKLMTTGNVQMTATESLMRGEEKMRLLGPAAGRIQSELLGPMIDRVFGLLLRHGKIPPPPRGIENEVCVEYVSPLAMIQKQQEAQAVLKTLEAASAVIALEPEAAKVFKGDEIIRKIGSVFGTSQSLMRSSAELKNAGAGDG